MSDMNFDSPNFNQPQKAKTGRNMTLMTCGGITAFVLLCCCCCIGGSYVALRQPVAPVTLWGLFMSTEDGSQTALDLVVCEGSQAADVTTELGNQGLLTNFSAVDDVGSDGVEVTATLQGSPWTATFFVTEGGSFPFSNCIDRIEVTSGE
jgi:hypothetical protein